MIVRYALYLAAYVWLPGHLLLSWVWRRRLSLSESIGVGLPLGWALEIGAYLACSALELGDFYRGWPVVSGLVLAGWLRRRQEFLGLIPVVARTNLGPAVVLAGVGLLFMVTTAARYYAPSPMWGQELLHATHHDWVYLISRAAEIKHHWPLEDPSLAGTPLSYHYYFMVHVAAAARVTGLEIPMVMLRLAVVPMAVVLLVQVFALGRIVGRSGWVGVIAAALLLLTGEVSWRESTSGGLFQSLFLEWLYVSPTFFFGLVFAGAIMWWFHRIAGPASVSLSEYALLLLLSVTATGAKGTAVGPLVAAAGPWGLWYLWRVRRWPGRMALATGVMLAGFMISFTFVLRQWSGDGAAIEPLSFLRASAFWLEHASDWHRALVSWGLPAAVSWRLVEAACLVTVFAGLNGVLLLGLAYPWVEDDANARIYGYWLGAVALACALFGHLLFLESHGETYLYLPMRLPLAVLAAAALFRISQKWPCWRTRAQPHGHDYRIAGVAFVLASVVCLIGSWHVSLWTGGLIGSLILFVLAPRAHASPVSSASTEQVKTGRLALQLAKVACLAGVGMVLAIQVNNLLLANRGGFRLWQLKAATGRDENLAALAEGLNWIRQRTPVNSVLIPNSFTLAHVGLRAPAAVFDDTTADKYYYYSALAERRVFVGGLAYVRDQEEALRRLRLATAIFDERLHVDRNRLPGQPFYAIVDRTVSTFDAGLTMSKRPVFENERLSIYRLRDLIRRSSRVAQPSDGFGEITSGGAEN